MATSRLANVGCTPTRPVKQLWHGACFWVPSQIERQVNPNLAEGKAALNKGVVNCDLIANARSALRHDGQVEWPELPRTPASACEIARCCPAPELGGGRGLLIRAPGRNEQNKNAARQRPDSPF